MFGTRSLTKVYEVLGGRIIRSQEWRKDGSCPHDYQDHQTKHSQTMAKEAAQGATARAIYLLGGEIGR
jgi:hypothetical protein